MCHPRLTFQIQRRHVSHLSQRGSQRLGTISSYIDPWFIHTTEGEWGEQIGVTVCASLSVSVRRQIRFILIHTHLSIEGEVQTITDSASV